MVPGSRDPGRVTERGPCLPDARAPKPDRRIAWTGHRPELFRDPAAARRRVAQVARQLISETAGSALRFLLGGQRGVDTWAALAALELEIPFALVLPLAPDAFSEGWAAPDREALQLTLARADRVHLVGGDPAGAYRERNRLLATGADLLVAVWTKTPGGGTAETMAFARAAGTPIREVLLAPAPGARRVRGRGI
jgi:hypothetical protein